MLSVIVAEACPSILETTLTLTPLDKSSVAQVCLRGCLRGPQEGALASLLSISRIIAT